MGTNDFYAINTLRKAYLHKYFIINLMECQAAIIIIQKYTTDIEH